MGYEKVPNVAPDFITHKYFFLYPILFLLQHMTPENFKEIKIRIN